ncbi:MAG: 7-cyano-7-deazaguanine synthase QueC [Deltaproteobacteria bacterium HGW-Deltaproteobacteria-17]|nr:MAG: 7-cyano-7-deazaguanine synthase QueC [Deltaproteobacteria bacterium HGW-Deltaproteobacteria-17]
MSDKAVILLSGGLDSSTVLAVARSRGFDLHALSFSYGQKHDFELAAARRIAAAFGVREHRILTLPPDLFGDSSLVGGAAVPKDRDPLAHAGIPSTYVPARNTIFLSYALAWAEHLEAADLFIGVSAVDFSGYPDCRPEFVAAFEQLANAATRVGTELGHHITVHAPLLHLSKKETIELGMSLGVDYGLTHTCYDPAPDGAACGRCDACVLRRRGFEAAGVSDPTRYA